MAARSGLALDDPRRADLALTGPGPYRVRDGKVWNEAVEVNVVDHCNLRCRSCSHLSPVLPKSAVDPAVVGADLTALGRVYHARVVRLLGGEPLLHPDLGAVVEAVRASGVCDRVRVCTNGVMLDRTPDSLWAAVDELLISTYPGYEPSASDLRRIDARAGANGVKVVVNRVREFRYSYAEQPRVDPVVTAQVFATCDVAHVWRCHTLAEGRLHRCAMSHYLNQALISPASPSFPVDGTLAELVAFLESPEPLPACANCLGTVGQRFPHSQVRVSGWRTEQDRPSEDLLDTDLLAQAMAGLETRASIS